MRAVFLRAAWWAVFIAWVGGAGYASTLVPQVGLKTLSVTFFTSLGLGGLVAVPLLLFLAERRSFLLNPPISIDDERIEDVATNSTEGE